jgi:nicotinate-nucleotide pyrophosphorylase (carboxylating)
MSRLSKLPPPVYEPLVLAALREDLGRAGDVTTDAIVSAQVESSGAIVARESGCVAGLDVARAAFLALDRRIEWRSEVEDGAVVRAGSALARLSGRARALLTAERVALNFLGRLSGIATATRWMVDAVEASTATIVCTRKTTPGLRALEKYAVRAGGGRNHRFGLDDAVLIKDNHVALAGGVAEAIGRARESTGHLVKIEVEVDNLEQLEVALATGVDVVLLDNFSLEELRAAVAMAAETGVLTEASGGVSPQTVADVAATGVDLISVGWLTHSAPTFDVGFDL